MWCAGLDLGYKVGTDLSITKSSISCWQSGCVIASCWAGRRGFKKAWRKLEETPSTMPINDTYQLKVEEWVWTCPAFAASCFYSANTLFSGCIRFLPSSLNPRAFMNCPSGGTKPWGHWRDITIIQRWLLCNLLRKRIRVLIWGLKGMMIIRMREVPSMKKVTTRK